MTLLEVNNLSVSHGKNEIISCISFDLSEGEVVLLEGKNGAGKSTLLKAIIGIYEKGAQFSGAVRINGSNNVLGMNDDELLALRSHIGYLEQKDMYDSYYGISVKNVLADSYEAFKNARLTKEDYSFIEKTFNEYIPDGAGISLSSKINKLSGGQQRMVSIIASLCLRKEAKIFIIDEPLNNLDINSIVHISNMLNRIRLENSKSLMIIVSHCKIFPFISKVVTINDGKVNINSENVICNACFGVPNANGFYE